MQDRKLIIITIGPYTALFEKIHERLDWLKNRSQVGMQVRISMNQVAHTCDLRGFPGSLIKAAAGENCRVSPTQHVFGAPEVWGLCNLNGVINFISGASNFTLWRFSDHLDDDLIRIFLRVVKENDCNRVGV